MNKEQKDTVRSELGKFFIDTAKLVIGGVILAGIMRTEYNPLVLIGGGFVSVLAFVCFGIWLINRNKK